MIPRFVEIGLRPLILCFVKNLRNQCHQPWIQFPELEGTNPKTCQARHFLSLPASLLPPPPLRATNSSRCRPLSFLSLSVFLYQAPLLKSRSDHSPMGADLNSVFYPSRVPLAECGRAQRVMSTLSLCPDERDGCQAWCDTHLWEGVLSSQSALVALLLGAQTMREDSSASSHDRNGFLAAGVGHF